MRLVPWLLAALLCLPSVSLARRPPRRVSLRHATKKKHVRRRERPVPTYTRDGLPNVQAQSALVLDMSRGTELYTRNADTLRPIASISKLMAMMVVLDRRLDLEQETVITENDRLLARRGARSRLPAGARASNRDLLHAALMASDNRAVLALGRAAGLDPTRLTAEMNRKARALGLAHTSFGDPTGLDDRNQSSAREVVAMLLAALKYPLIADITRKPRYQAYATLPNGRRQVIDYGNTDIYTQRAQHQVLGGKTGYTDQAGYCLTIAAHLAGGDVAMAFLGAHGKMTRFADFARVAQWLAEKKSAANTSLAGHPVARHAPRQVRSNAARRRPR